MKGLLKFARENPEVASLIAAIARAVLLGHNADEKNALLSKVTALDSDGDGVPDTLDKEPKNPRKK